MKNAPHSPSELPSPVGHPLLWLLMGTAGALCLALNPYTLSLLTVDCLFVGVILLAGSTIGLSTHLSTMLKKPSFNLWEKSKFFVKTHPILVAGAALGFIFSMSAVFTLITATVGLVVEDANAESKSAFKDYCAAKWQSLQRFFTRKQPKSLANPQMVATLSTESVQLPKENPVVSSFMHRPNPKKEKKPFPIGKILSYSAAILLCILITPWVLPVLSSIGAFIAHIFNTISEIIASISSGGVIPYFLVKGFALAVEATNGALFLAFFAGAMGHLIYHVGQEIYITVEPYYHMLAENVLHTISFIRNIPQVTQQFCTHKIAQTQKQCARMFCFWAQTEEYIETDIEQGIDFVPNVVLRDLRENIVSNNEASDTESSSEEIPQHTQELDQVVTDQTGELRRRKNIV